MVMVAIQNVSTLVSSHTVLGQSQYAWSNHIIAICVLNSIDRHITRLSVCSHDSVVVDSRLSMLGNDWIADRLLGVNNTIAPSAQAIHVMLAVQSEINILHGDTVLPVYHVVINNMINDKLTSSFYQVPLNHRFNGSYC